MPINAKAKGTRLEYKTIERLTRDGYKCTRAAASLGAWDLIAISQTRVILIQVKSNRNPGSEEMAKLARFRAPKSCRREVWVWKDRAKDPIITKVEPEPLF